ncbi:hypothetical protein ACEQ8H_007411 [Pleosporales sp. CAS-2024a]
MAAVTNATTSPHHDMADDMNALILGITVPALTLALIFLFVRFYGRGLLRQTLGFDDCVMLFAMLFALPVSSFPLASRKYGLGQHEKHVKPEMFTPYSKMNYAADLLFPAACSLTKISLCLTYLRLFPDNTARNFCFAMMTFVIMFSLASFFMSLFQCTPIRGYWDLTVAQKCIDMHVALISIASVNSFSDFMIYLYPAKPLWSLRLPVKQRLGLIFLFSIGLLVCIAGVLRMYFLDQYFKSTDYHWNAAKVWMCMVLEMNLGIMCACLSGVKPVLATLFPTLFGSSYKSRSGATPKLYGNYSTRKSRTEQFPFEELQDAPSTDDVQRRASAQAVSVDTVLQGDDKMQRNFAWASSNGEMVADSTVPMHAIRIAQVVTIEEEDASALTPPSERHAEPSDAGSEEWIMEDHPQHRTR